MTLKEKFVKNSRVVADSQALGLQIQNLKEFLELGDAQRTLLRKTALSKLFSSNYALQLLSHYNHSMSGFGEYKKPIINTNVKFDKNRGHQGQGH